MEPWKTPGNPGNWFSLQFGCEYLRSVCGRGSPGGNQGIRHQDANPRGISNNSQMETPFLAPLKLVLKCFLDFPKSFLFIFYSFFNHFNELK